MAHTNRQEDLVRALLSEVGYLAEPIPVVQGAKRADLHARRGDGDEFVVEVKTRGENEDFARDFATTGRAIRAESSDYLNPLSSRLAEAAEQIGATPRAQHTPGICVALCLDPHSARAQCEQWKGTALGFRGISSRCDMSRKVSCAFWQYPTFRNTPEIDALLVVETDSEGRLAWQLVPNPFGVRQDRLRGSALYRECLAGNAVFDLARMEDQGVVYVLPDDLRRHGATSEEKLAWLAERYGIDGPFEVEMTRLKSAVRLKPRPG